MLTVLPHVAHSNIFLELFESSSSTFIPCSLHWSDAVDATVSWQFKMQKGVPHLDSDNVAQQTPPSCLLDLAPSSYLPPL